MISDIDLMVMRRRVMIMTKVMIKIDENYPIWHANEAKMKIPKNPKRFPLNPGIKNIGKSRPEKSRDPGIWQNPVLKNPGIEILDPARAWWGRKWRRRWRWRLRRLIRKWRRRCSRRWRSLLRENSIIQKSLPCRRHPTTRQNIKREKWQIHSSSTYFTWRLNVWCWVD